MSQIKIYIDEDAMDSDLARFPATSHSPRELARKLCYMIIISGDRSIGCMNLTIELPDEPGATVKALARAQGLSPDRFISRVLENTLSAEIERGKAGQPFQAGYGMRAKYGPAPCAEEIDENRREMLGSFAQER